MVGSLELEKWSFRFSMVSKWFRVSVFKNFAIFFLIRCRIRLLMYSVHKMMMIVRVRPYRCLIDRCDVWFFYGRYASKNEWMQRHCFN